MAYDIKVTDQAYVPIQATVTYYDVGSNNVGTQEISKSGGQLNQALLDKAFDITFTAPGYYDFNAPVSSVSVDSNDVTLQKKPDSITMPVAIAFVVGFFAGKLLRL